MGLRKMIKNDYHKMMDFRDIFKFDIYLLKHKKERELLKRNIELKNKYANKRCFVLGNGPSLNEEDLSTLKEEYVFTVNQIAKHRDFKKINTNFHFWADPVFFDLDITKPEDKQLLDTMKAVNTEGNSPLVFFPIEQLEFAERTGLDKVLNIRYYKSALIFRENYSGKFRYDKCVPGFGTVVQWCVTMAIYMGFKEIYLLGCDNTGIIMNIKSFIKANDDEDYAYELSDDEKKRMQNVYKRVSLESFVKSYLQTLIGYRTLNEYCTKRDIKLVNCSSTTTIDSIPRMPLESVLNN